MSEALKFTYRGKRLEEIEAMSMDELIKILPARARRSLRRGIKPEQTPLIEKIRKAKKVGASSVKLKTHCRDLVILPEMIGLTINIHSGKEYVPIEVKPEMLGHFLGEYAVTNKKVVHGEPGLRATRSSMYVPLK
ncbi:MAG: 30S ribosomal protein S19 [Candidatus Marsarchaeota archaeon]|nr:30S ribosomal protein S19 [Candidatus Marsarchaeota archaeon]